MKRKIFIIYIIFMILSTTFVYANSVASITLNSSSNSVKKGETFKVVLHGKCADGINGFSANYSYDSDYLELVNATVCDSNKWSNLGVNNELAVICNSSSKITDSNLFEFIFRVNDTAKEESKLEIAISNIILDSDKSTDSNINIENQKIFVTIAKNVSTDNKPNTNNPSENKPGTSVDNPSNNTPEQGSNSNVNNKPEQGINNTSSKPQSGTNSSNITSNSSSSAATGKIPQTGSNITFIFVLIGSLIAMFVSFLLYRKYKDII